MRARRWVVFGGQAVVVAACGSRTGLLVPVETTGEEGGPGDSGEDATEEPDAIAPHDATSPRDAREEDALPPIDVIVPPDGPGPCPDAGSTLVYVITTQDVLMSFYPPTAAFSTIGSIVCPTAVGDHPFSMAVDRTGVAYVEFQSGRDLPGEHADRRVRPHDLRAAARLPERVRHGLRRHAGQRRRRGRDALPVGRAGLPERADGAGDPRQARHDELQGHAHRHGHADIFTPELTGTGAGQLFAFYGTSGGTAVGEIDTQTGQLLSPSDLPGVTFGAGWAFAFWGGDFYTFTAPGGDSVVTRFRPGDGTVTLVATTPGRTIVGAGVSTCAPQM